MAKLTLVEKFNKIKYFLTFLLIFPSEIIKHIYYILSLLNLSLNKLIDSFKNMGIAL